MTKELVKIKDLEKIEGSKKILSSFEPKAKELNDLYPEYNEIVSGFATAAGVSEKELDTAEEAKQAQAAIVWAEKAKELRSKMVKVRTSTAAVHKEVKAEYLPVTKAIDAMNRIIRDTSQEAEATLQFIAETEKRIEALKLERLENERIQALTPYADGNPLPSGLAAMDDATWNAVLTGWKANHDQKVKDDAEAEELRVKKELGTDRKLTAAPYADYITGFIAMDFSEITEEEFAGILNKAKADKQKIQDDRDAEMEELRNKAATTSFPVAPEQKSEPAMTTPAPSTPYIKEVKDYLFGKMMSAPTPQEGDLIRRAMETLG